MQKLQASCLSLLAASTLSSCSLAFSLSAAMLSALLRSCFSTSGEVEAFLGGGCESGGEEFPVLAGLGEWGEEADAVGDTLAEVGVVVVGVVAPGRADRMDW